MEEFRGIMLATRFQSGEAGKISSLVVVVGRRLGGPIILPSKI